MRKAEGVTTGAALRLRPFRVEDEHPAIAAHHELAAEGFDLLEAWTPDLSWADYVARLERMRDGIDLPDGWVPFTLLAADVTSQLVGCASLRHRLNDHLAEVGGHIGYAVRPQFRRRGYATQMLKQTLQVASDLGIDRALLTCNNDNLASAMVIERCGGQLARVLPAANSRPAKRHYWIDTP